MMALRRGKLVGLDLEHLDLAAGTVDLLGKGVGSAHATPAWPPSTRCSTEYQSSRR